jgi:glucose dehydrogenase
MAKWAYQLNPHDLYDYDGVNENVLLDLNIDNQTRHVLAHADRNGFMYVMDRLSGSWCRLSRTPTSTSLHALTWRPADR